MMNFKCLYARHIHPEIFGLAQYANELAGDADLPKRSQFNPSCISAILPYVFLVDRQPDLDDYVFRICGEQMWSIFGVDLTGMRLSEVPNYAVQTCMRNTYARVLETHTPLFMRARYLWPDKSLSVERLLVPMTNDAGLVAAICGIVVPDVAAVDLDKFRGEGPAQLVCDEELMLKAA
jgi:hypothetical protein